MADSEEIKSVEAEYESEAEEISPLRWTARRREASDDDDDDDDDGSDRRKVREKFRWSSCDDESDGLDGASEYDEGGVEEELEEVSQEEVDESKLQETVRLNMGKEKKALSDEVFVPRSGWFYMHDDRFRSRRYGRRRGTVIGMKLWDCTDEQKWKHDKFEDMTDKSAPKIHHQQQCKNQSKGHRYADTNQFGSLDNFGNQNNKTSRIVKGRGPVKYKPIVKSNNLNPSSKHQIHAKLKESTPSSSSRGVSSRALATSSDSCGPRVQQLISNMDSLPVSNSITSRLDIFMTQRSNEQYRRSNKYIPTSIQQDVKQPVSLLNVLLQKKTVSNISESHGCNIEDSTQLVDDKHFTNQPILFPMSAKFLQMEGKMAGYSFPTQQMYQPCSIQNSDNRIPLPQLYPVIEQSPITNTIQGGKFGHDLVGRGGCVLQGAVRGSFQLGGSPSLLPVMQLGGLPYGAVDDHTPSMALVGYAPQPQLGSRNCGMTSMIAGAAKSCNISKPLADRSELVENEFRQRRLKPQRYSKMR